MFSMGALKGHFSAIIHCGIRSDITLNLTSTFNRNQNTYDVIVENRKFLSETIRTRTIVITHYPVFIIAEFIGNIVILFKLQNINSSLKFEILFYKIIIFRSFNIEFNRSLSMILLLFGIMTF